MFSAAKNRWLIINDGVELTELTDRCAASLDTYFERAQLHALVTSGVRSVEKQLNLIRTNIIRHKLAGEFQEVVSCRPRDVIQWGGQAVYVWQPAWSKLLTIGVKIDPLFPAKVLMDYIGSAGKNLKGHELQPSAHIAGSAFDIGGGLDGTSQEAAIIKLVVDEKLIPEIVYYLEEKNPANNCVHVDCREKI